MFDFNNAYLYFNTGKKIALTPEITKTTDGFKIKIPSSSIPKSTEYLDLFSDTIIGAAGDDGYFVMPSQLPADFLCEFNVGEDAEKEYSRYSMPIFGFKKGEEALLGVVSSMTWEHKIIIKRENNKYYIFPRFNLLGHGAYEDIVIEYFCLYGDDANYVGIAKRYRKYQKDKGAFKTLTEKITERPNLKGIADSVNIRIRMGWKPVPAEIAEQTVENEPEMKVAMTFDRLSELIDSMQSAGVKKADICLVGWNIKGHDGRWPQMLPVEEALGGEKKLRKAIKKAERVGYTINAHTNSSDAYTIADNFNLDDIIVNKDSSIAAGNFL